MNYLKEKIVLKWAKASLFIKFICMLVRYRANISESQLVAFRRELARIAKAESVVENRTPENINLVYGFAIDKFYDYREKARDIDKKASTALASIVVAGTALFLSQRFAELDILPQSIIITTFLIITLLILVALKHSNFKEPRSGAVIEGCKASTLTDAKKELLNMYYKCDKKNNRLLQIKTCAYNSALVITILLIAFVVFALTKIFNNETLTNTVIALALVTIFVFVSSWSSNK